MPDQTHHPECWRDPAHHACAVREVERLRGAAEEPLEMCLCESHRLILRPGKLYRFRVDPDCEKCVEMGRTYERVSRYEEHRKLARRALERVEEGG